MTQTLSTIRDLSGDSTARDIAFAGGTVRFVFDDYDSDQTVSIEITTDTAIIPARTGPFQPVLPTLISLADILPQQANSGIYIAPTSIGDLMDATRQGAHLALGRRASEWQFVFQLVGYRTSLICLVANEDAIRITPA
ncbi:MAG: hypothetical protein NXI22_20125 [bacterium]|nr:hypothetical protein [bacterium]